MKPGTYKSKFCFNTGVKGNISYTESQKIRWHCHKWHVNTFTGLNIVCGDLNSVGKMAGFKGWKQMPPGPNMKGEQNYHSLQKTIQNIAISDLYRSYPMLSFAGQWPFIMSDLTRLLLQCGMCTAYQQAKCASVPLSIATRITCLTLHEIDSQANSADFEPSNPWTLVGFVQRGFCEEVNAKCTRE